MGVYLIKRNANLLLGVSRHLGCRILLVLYKCSFVCKCLLVHDLVSGQLSAVHREQGIEW